MLDTIAVMATVALSSAGHTPATHVDKFDHAGCQTRRCERRMIRKAHAGTRRRWARTTRHYRGWLYSVRMCESGGNYRTNTGNGFYDAYQFVPSTWWGVGGRGMPHLAEPLEQDYRAVLLRQRAGTSPWPVCG